METKVADLQNNISFEDANKESISYFNGDDLAAKVFLDKYSLKDNFGNFLERTPRDMHQRLASEFARIEKKKFKNPLTEDEIFSYFDRFTYIVPQGSPMFGIGNDYQTISLSNCYVLDVPEDSYGSILKVDEQLVQISKRRGGVGIDISNLRPAGSQTKNAARSSTGIIPFMERYSNSIREVGQNNRRGALMLTLSCFGEKTFVLTDSGWENIVNVINDVKNGKIKRAWTHDGFKQIIDTQEIKDRELYEVECENGKKIEVTADHKFVVKNTQTGGEYLKELQNIDVSCEEIIFYD